MVVFYNNVTGRHRGPKRKLRAGYRAPSVQRTSYLCHVESMHRSVIMLHTLYFSSSSVVSRALSALCVCSKFGHQPHPYRLPLRQISFLLRPRLAHGEKLCILNHSITHSPSLFDVPGTEAFAIGSFPAVCYVHFAIHWLHSRSFCQVFDLGHMLHDIPRWHK